MTIEAPVETVRAAAQWMAEAARFLRQEGQPASTAEVIEAVRLARMLARFRNREEPGEDELLEAAQCALCEGGQTLSTRLADHMRPPVPAQDLPEAGSLALLEDFLRTCKKLRLNLRAEPTPLALDLRLPRDLTKSQFLHRLTLLKLDCAKAESGSGRARGTFRERWVLTWSEASRARLELLSKRSFSIESAVEAALSRRTGRADSLPTLAQLAETAFLAGMPAALDSLLGKIEYSAALAAEFQPLAATLGPLAKIACHGTVRPAEAQAARRCALALAHRASLALPAACQAVDENAASELQELLTQVHASMTLLNHSDTLEPWRQALGATAESARSHPLLAGTATRLLLTLGAWPPARTCQAMERELSAGASPPASARWLEGFFGYGQGSTVQHQEVLNLINAWLLALSPEAFLHCLPLLRRTFSRLSVEDRRQLRQRMAAASPSPPASTPHQIAPTPMSMTSRLLRRTNRKEVP